MCDQCLQQYHIVMHGLRISHEELWSILHNVQGAKDCSAVPQVVQDVATAQQAVELLLPQGDYVGALDVLDSLHAMLATQATAGLHAFRRLPAQLRDISEVCPPKCCCQVPPTFCPTLWRSHAVT